MALTLEQLQKFSSNLLRIQPGEGRKASMMFGVMLCVVGSFIIARVARDSLFLSRYTIDYLPYLYIWVAVGVSIQSYLYSRIADRFRRDRMFIITLAIVFVLFVAARLALVWTKDWFYPALYVMVELVGSLLLIQAWTLINEIFTSREAKRLFGFIGAGGVVSSVVVGFSIKEAINFINTEDLLLLSAGLFLMAMLLTKKLATTCQEELLHSIATGRKGIRSRISLFSDWQRTFTSRHLIFVAGLVLILSFVMTFVDYRFKLSAHEAFSGEEDKLAGFFGLFYGLTGLLNIVIQALATARILERFGVTVSLLLLPIALMVGTVFWIATPILLSATLLKGADSTLRYTVNDATVQLLYLPVPSYLRGRAKAFIDGIIRPVSIGIAGISLAWILPNLAPAALGWILFVLLLGWIAITFLVRKEYLASLVSTLKARRLDFSNGSRLIPDQAASQALLEALEDPDEENVLHALGMIPHSPGKNWGNALIKLTKHESARVRAQAIKRIGDMGSLQHGPVIYACLRDSNPNVLAAAIHAYCSIGKERAVRTGSLFLEHEDLQVRAAAVVGMIRYGGLDGVLSSAERLKALLNGTEAEERATGARILGAIKVQNFYHPLLKLMSDESIPVRLAAIWAAGRMKSQELLPALVYRLDTTGTRSAASEAIVAIGEPAVPVLHRVLTNHRELLATRMVIPMLLAEIGTQAALDAMTKNLSCRHINLRSQIIEGLHRIRSRRPHLSFHRESIRKALDSEIHEQYTQAFITLDLKLDATTLLAEARAQHRFKSVRRIFRLLGCLFPHRATNTVYANYLSSKRMNRANALEVLDHLLDKKLKHLLLPLLDENLVDDLKSVGLEVYGLKSRSPSAHMVALIDEPDIWLGTCAIQYTGFSPIGYEGDTKPLIKAVTQKTQSEEPLLRETALLVLYNLVPRDEFIKTAKPHKEDPSPKVRHLAIRLCES
jgi:ATP/ADP translocase